MAELDTPPLSRVMSSSSTLSAIHSPPITPYDALSSSSSPALATTDSMPTSSSPTLPLRDSSPHDQPSSLLRVEVPSSTGAAGGKTLRHARSWIEELPSDDEDSPRYMWRGRLKRQQHRSLPDFAAHVARADAWRQHETEQQIEEGDEEQEEVVEEEDGREWLFRADELEAARARWMYENGHDHLVDEDEEVSDDGDDDDEDGQGGPWSPMPHPDEDDEGHQLDDVDSDFETRDTSPPTSAGSRRAPTAGPEGGTTVASKRNSTGASFFLAPRPAWVRRRPSRLALSTDDDGSPERRSASASTPAERRRKVDELTSLSQRYQHLVVAISWSILVACISILTSVGGSVLGGKVKEWDLENRTREWLEWGREWGVDVDLMRRRLGEKFGGARADEEEQPVEHEHDWDKCSTCGK